MNRLSLSITRAIGSLSDGGDCSVLDVQCAAYSVQFMVSGMCAVCRRTVQCAVFSTKCPVCNV